MVKFISYTFVDQILNSDTYWVVTKRGKAFILNN